MPSNEAPMQREPAEAPNQQAGLHWSYHHEEPRLRPEGFNAAPYCCQLGQDKVFEFRRSVIHSPIQDIFILQTRLYG